MAHIRSAYDPHTISIRFADNYVQIICYVHSIYILLYVNYNLFSYDLHIFVCNSCSCWTLFSINGCVTICRKQIEYLSNIDRTYWTYIDIYRKYIETRSTIYRTSIEHISNVYITSIEHISIIYRNSIVNLSNIYRISIDILSNFYRTSI